VNGKLSFRMFAHSWISDWNHGNAHFLRGLASELVKGGHQVRCYEESDGWSLRNLAKEGPHSVAEARANFCQAFPELDVRFYRQGAAFDGFLEDQLKDADIVIVHEWNSPPVVSAILRLKAKLKFQALFHDTHHRAYTNPREILRLGLEQFDGVLAFGEAIRRIYLEAFDLKRAWTFHEAADTAHFFPLEARQDTDVIWIGNWGDEERTRELEEFLVKPAAAMSGYRFAVHGVRYPNEARKRLEESKIQFRGYLPNLRAPEMYARSKVSLHVPRRFYANGLSGVPTIRVFEALAAGSPLMCSPWSDSENLFRPGEDFVCAPDSEAMIAELKSLLRDPRARQQLAASGLNTIRRRHTCAHRADQLVDICYGLNASSSLAPSRCQAQSAYGQPPTNRDPESVHRGEGIAPGGNRA
jgi:spore maturation protein CgeB